MSNTKIETDRARELRWRAEEDARALVQALDIKSDKQRLSRAIKVAKELADKAKKEALRYSKIGSKK